MTIGFKIDEVMTGYHHFCDVEKESHFMEFNITWGPKDLLKWLNPFSKFFLKQPLTGFVTVGGFCKNVPCEGTLELKYFKNASIRYEFTFLPPYKDGKLYKFVGEKKNIYPWNIHKTHTTCYGELIECSTNKLISKSTTYFDLKTLFSFLKSFRLTY